MSTEEPIWVAVVLRLYSILTCEESLAVSLGSLLKSVEQGSAQASKNGDARTKRVHKNTGVEGMFLCPLNYVVCGTVTEKMSKETKKPSDQASLDTLQHKCSFPSPAGH